MCAGIFVFAPFNGYCLDRLGFGIVLLAINVMSLAAAVLQSIPVLELQVRASFHLRRGHIMSTHIHRSSFQVPLL